MREQPEVRYDPLNGECIGEGWSKHPNVWRSGGIPWRYDPWTGAVRKMADERKDPYGREIWHDELWGPREEPTLLAPAALMSALGVEASEAKPTDSIGATLTERGARYGNFTGHATVTQMLKRVIAARIADREMMLDDDQQEALDMICHKIGRIINGDPDYADSWVDIAGYAKLVADRLQGEER